MKKTLIISLCICALLVAGILWRKQQAISQTVTKTVTETLPEIVAPLNPLSIESMKNREYPGSEVTIEEKLPDGSNYSQYIASYQSDGLKIYALLTVPKGTKPEGGWPVIIFNHGYIPPKEYRTTEKYVAYVSTFARNGYIVFKPDYRGHGSSEGTPEGAYFSPAYTIDDLNAISSIKKYPDANPEKVGAWGHSMGGNITLRGLVVRPTDIKVAVIWGGVVGSYDDIINQWRRPSNSPPPQLTQSQQSARARIVEQFGNPNGGSPFWMSIDPTHYVNEIQAPVQIHHGTGDTVVPLLFSENLQNRLQSAGKVSELYTYKGADHNIAAPSFSLAMQRSVVFFDKYLK